VNATQGKPINGMEEEWGEEADEKKVRWESEKGGVVNGGI
jgi:hypothetical protein